MAKSQGGRVMNKRTYHLVVAAMLSAVAYLLMFVEVAIPALIPNFIKMDISDLPALLGAFSLGPVYGIVISFLKNVLHAFVAPGTSTGYVGELCNFLLGAAFSFSAGLIYKHKKTKTTALVGALVGSVVMGLISLPANYFITYPLYASMYGGMENIIVAYKVILPSADTLLKCLVIFNIPFTIVKGLLCSVICLLIYKPLSPILHGNK
jgi:riboflavin transporter FmnP